MNYIVIELQTNGEATAQLDYPCTSYETALQKYYTILATAVVSPVETHAALIVDEEGKTHESKCYRHGGNE